METELILALKGVEEIDDIGDWETALVNAIKEYAFQVKLWIAKTTPVNSPDKHERDEDTSVDWFESFWKICVNKMKDYKQTIHELSSTINLNDIEITEFRQDNFRLKEVNAIFSANMDKLKDYLNKADADNLALRTENENLLTELRNLESSVKALELKNEELTKKIIDEEVEKYQSNIENLQSIVDQQAEYMKRLHLEVDEYNLLKSMYEQAKKENTVITPLRREVSKLEETIFELNKDYQDIIVSFSNGTCACVNTLNETTPRDVHLSDRGKNSTATSRVIYESDDETQNKNQLANRESVSLTPGRNKSHHAKKKSLMDEVIFTKHSDRPLSYQELRFETKPLTLRQTGKFASTNNFGSSGFPPPFSRRNFLRSKIKQATSERGEDEEQINSQRTNSAACDEGGLSKRTREIISSELNSEGGDTYENRDEKSPIATSEANCLDMDLPADVFEKEQILLSWEENDFPKLNSRTSYRSRTKRSFQGILDPNERKKSSEASSGHKNKRRFKALSNMYKGTSMPSIIEKTRRKAETPGINSSAISLDGYQSVDNQPNETKNMGILLRQKLEGLKIRQELAEKLASRITSSAQKVQKINLEPLRNIRDFNSVNNRSSISAIEEEETARLDMSNTRVEQIPLLGDISKGNSEILSAVKLSSFLKRDTSLTEPKVEHMMIPNGTHLLLGFNKENEKETKDNSLSRSNKNPLSSDRNIKTVERSIQTEHEPIHIPIQPAIERREVVERSIQTEYEPMATVQIEEKKEVTEQSIQTDYEPIAVPLAEQRMEVVEKSTQTEHESIDVTVERKEVVEQSIQTEHEPMATAQIEEKKEIVERSIQTECEPITVPLAEQKTEVVEKSIQTDHEPMDLAPSIIVERKDVAEQSIQTEHEPIATVRVEKNKEFMEQSIQTGHELMQIALRLANERREVLERSIQTEDESIVISLVDEKKEVIEKSIQTEDELIVQIEEKKQVIEQSIQTELELTPIAMPLAEKRKEIIGNQKENINKDLQASSTINLASDVWSKVSYLQKAADDKTTQTSLSNIHEHKKANIPSTISEPKSKSVLSSVLLSSVPFVAGASVTYLLLRGKLRR